MDLSRHFILLNGEAKTLQIDTIEKKASQRQKTSLQTTMPKGWQTRWQTCRVTKQPVLAIETDGYSFHNSETEQHRRDLHKDSILKK